MEDIQLDFSEESLLFLNVLIGYIMFGVSMTLKKEDFFLLIKRPKPVITGVISQFLLLPFLTIILIFLFKIDLSVALGMILVAACPGGPVSNFFSSIAHGNVALSISLTAIATVLAIILTPLNFEIWSSFLPNIHGTNEFSLDFFSMLKTIGLIIGLPVILGLWVGSHYPGFVVKSAKAFRVSSFIILVAFIAVAFAKNIEYFLDYIPEIFLLVLVHNALAFIGAYSVSRILKNDEPDIRSITMETGIQNSALALIIIFNFFDGNGPMSLVAAWWGIWHLITGTILSQFWRKRSLSPIKRNE